MLLFICKRLVALGPILLVMSVVVFGVLRLGQGDPAMSSLRLSQLPPTDENLAEARRELGLDRPLPEQYLAWLSRAVRGDFGKSYVTRNDVLGDVLYYLPNTLRLAGASLLLTMLVSLPLGVWSAVRKDRLPDHLARGFAYAGVSMPSFWLGFLLVWLFSVKLGWLPSMGMGGMGGMGSMAHILMPALTMSFMSMAINARLIRASMLENMHGRHALYARSRGLAERTVLGRHVLLNASVPVVTAVGMHIGELFGGAVVAETIFAWPGLGRYAVSAIYNRDYPVLQCFILLMTTIFVLVNLAVDVLYAWMDPRVRAQEQS